MTSSRRVRPRPNHPSGRAADGQQPGSNIQVTGSATLVRWLLRQGLLDELQLMVCPIVVGDGRRLFQDWSQQLPLRLVDATTFATGVLSLGYAPAGD